MQKKESSCYQQGFIGASILLFTLYLLNFIIGVLLLSVEMNEHCLDRAGHAVGLSGIKIIETPHSYFCYKIANSTINSYTYLSSPDFKGTIKCNNQTFFWEKKCSII